MKCPKCGKELTYEDYETYYDEENEDTSYYILCSDCGYDESEVEQYGKTKKINRRNGAKYS